MTDCFSMFSPIFANNQRLIVMIDSSLLKVNSQRFFMIDQLFIHCFYLPINVSLCAGHQSRHWEQPQRSHALAGQGWSGGLGRQEWSVLVDHDYLPYQLLENSGLSYGFIILSNRCYMGLIIHCGTNHRILAIISMETHHFWVVHNFWTKPNMNHSS